jgi:nitrite reductase/ring-hydroxylating ferredoxin subunit
LIVIGDGRIAKFQRVANVDNIPPDKGMVVAVDGKEIAVFNVGGNFYAIDNICTHRGGPLGEGYLRGKVISCPWHGAQFDVTNGQIVSPPAPSNAPIYFTRVKDGGVWVEI